MQKNISVKVHMFFSNKRIAWEEETGEKAEPEWGTSARLCLCVLHSRVGPDLPTDPTDLSGLGNCEGRNTGMFCEPAAE